MPPVMLFDKIITLSVSFYSHDIDFYRSTRFSKTIKINFLCSTIDDVSQTLIDQARKGTRALRIHYISLRLHSAIISNRVLDIEKDLRNLN